MRLSVVHTAMLLSALRALCVLLLGASVAGAQLVSGDWGYTLTSEGVPPAQVVVITTYNGLGGNVVVPSEIDGKPVRRVGNGTTSIDSLSRITRIVFPDGITSIAAAAFYRCGNLTNVHLGTTVTNIGLTTFARCSRLTSIQMPNSVTALGDYAFWRGASLTNAMLSSSLTNIGFATFADCPKLAEIVIPSSVTDVGNYAFNNAIGLTNVVMPQALTNIGDYAFSFCRTLPKVTIPNSVRTIGSNAFAQCLSLAEVTIGKGVTNVGYAAFIYSDSLITVTIPDAVLSLPDDLFFDSARLTSVIIGSGVSGIGDDAFGSCESLSSVLFRGAPPTATGTNMNMFGLSTPQIYFLPGAPGWGALFAGRPTSVFAPVAEEAGFVGAGQFSFGWSGTGQVPMDVQRRSSLSGVDSWDTVARGVTDGAFVDTNPPAGSAYYRSVLP
jgi:hypothetical protein